MLIPCHVPIIFIPENPTCLNSSFGHQCLFCGRGILHAGPCGLVAGVLVGCSGLAQTSSVAFRQLLSPWVVVFFSVWVCREPVAGQVEKTSQEDHWVDVESLLGPEIYSNVHVT